MNLAYSYIRFSTPAQKLGRSYERQMEACEKWCKDNEITLSDDRFLDDGRSGYTGEHLGEKGQLKRFVDLVDAETIQPGSYLIVESLDRLSRQNVWDALPFFMSLVTRGIKVVTLADNRVFTQASDKDALILSIFVMVRAHEESANKARVIRDDWASKLRRARETGRPVGRAVVKWVDLVDRKTKHDHGRYVLNEERAAIVRRVFKMCVDGYGVVSIARILNQEPETKPFRGKTWCGTSIFDMLRNRCVLGEWEPKDGKGVIHNYFPQVIDHDTWALAQLGIEQRARFHATKQTPDYQVWNGVGLCGKCHAPMYKLTNTSTKRSKSTPPIHYTYTYMCCSNKRKGLCDPLRVPLEDTERVFKELLVKVGALSLIQSDSAAVDKAVQVIDGQTLHQRQLHEQHMNAAAKGLGGVGVYRLIEKAEEEIARLTAEREKLEKTQAEEATLQSDKAWLLENIPLKEYEERHRANSLLKRLGVKVYITTGEEETVYIATRPVQTRVRVETTADGQEARYEVKAVEKPFLQIVDSEDGQVVVPLTAEQRERFAEQDVDGQDSAKLDDFLYATIGAYSAGAEKRAAEKSELPMVK